MAFTLIMGARHSLAPPSTGGNGYDAAGFASCYGPHRRSPFTGLLTLGSDPARFPAEPPACYRASWQLPGLPPAGDDELTNTKTNHDTRSRCHLLPYWAHITGHYPAFPTGPERGHRVNTGKCLQRNRPPPGSQSSRDARPGPARFSNATRHADQGPRLLVRAGDRPGDPLSVVVGPGPGRRRGHAGQGPTSARSSRTSPSISTPFMTRRRPATNSKPAA